MAHMTGSVDSKYCFEKVGHIAQTFISPGRKMINPFQESTRLINIATGQLATSDEYFRPRIEDSMLCPKQKKRMISKYSL